MCFLPIWPSWCYLLSPWWLSPGFSGCHYVGIKFTLVLFCYLSKLRLHSDRRLSRSRPARKAQSSHMLWECLEKLRRTFYKRSIPVHSGRYCSTTQAKSCCICDPMQWRMVQKRQLHRHRHAQLLRTRLSSSATCEVASATGLKTGRVRSTSSSVAQLTSDNVQS